MNCDSTYINKKYSLGIWHCCYKNRFAIFVFHFFLKHVFGLKKENHIWTWHCCENMFVFLFCSFDTLDLKMRNAFSPFKKKNHIFSLNPLFHPYSIASINIYVQSTSEIYDVIWIIFFFFFTQLNMLRKMVLLRKRGCWQFWEFLLL